MTIGPHKIRNTQGPKQKFECECHLCNWAYFKWTIDEARDILVDHIETAHLNPPPMYFPTAAEMPGH